MRTSIVAIALIMAVGLPATVQLGNFSNDAAAQEFVNKKRKSMRPYAKKGEFNYRLCRDLGGTAHRCGVRLHYWGNRNPNGKVIY